jgi:hypothetical protein
MNFKIRIKKKKHAAPPEHPQIFQSQLLGIKVFSALFLSSCREN